MCERLLIWSFICCWNCTGKEINVNDIKAFTIVLILNFVLGIWCDLFFFLFFFNSNTYLRNANLSPPPPKKGMLILAIKESLHFFSHIYKNDNLLCCLWDSHQMVFPHPSIIRFSHLYLQSRFTTPLIFSSSFFFLQIKHRLFH